MIDGFLDNSTDRLHACQTDAVGGQALCQVAPERTKPGIGTNTESVEKVVDGYFGGVVISGPPRGGPLASLSLSSIGTSVQQLASCRASRKLRPEWAHKGELATSALMHPAIVGWVYKE